MCLSMPQCAKRTIIAVDGLAASGKSTLAKNLAKRLNFICFSSGILYRALAWAALRSEFKPERGDDLANFLASIEFTLSTDPKTGVVLKLNGQEPGQEIYGKEVSKYASILAAQTEVRKFLMPIQRQAFPGHSMVVEGRDIGTVVFPDADLKFFIRADIAVRVDRRFAQRCDLGDKALKSEIERELLERDQRDTQREFSPAIAAPDAIIIDNSAQTLTSVLENMYHHVLKAKLVNQSS